MQHLRSSRHWFAVLAMVGCGWLAAQQPAPQRPSILSENPTIVIPYDCGDLDVALLASLRVVRTVCPLALLGGASFQTLNGTEESLVAFDTQNAVVAIHSRLGNATSSFIGTIDHTGQQGDTIFWGLWRNGTLAELPSGHRRAIDENIAIPYIVGVKSNLVAANDRVAGRLHRFTALPTDATARYTQIGDVGIVSQKDYQGNIVPVGKVANAQATMDFKNRTGQLEMSVAVRGTTATIQLGLEPAGRIGGFDSGAQSLKGPCRLPAPEEFCPTATVRFFGRDGEFLGITFSYGHQTVLSEADSVGARLNNVLAQGAVVLRKVH
jgi:hypothetical protein